MLSVRVLSLDEFLAQMCPYESGDSCSEPKWARMSREPMVSFEPLWVVVSEAALHWLWALVCVSVPMVRPNLSVPNEWDETEFEWEVT